VRGGAALVTLLVAAAGSAYSRGAERSRTDPNPPERSRTEPNRAGRTRAEPNRAEPSRNAAGGSAGAA